MWCWWCFYNSNYSSNVRKSRVSVNQSITWIWNEIGKDVAFFNLVTYHNIHIFIVKRVKNIWFSQYNTFFYILLTWFCIFICNPSISVSISKYYDVSYHCVYVSNIGNSRHVILNYYFAQRQFPYIHGYRLFCFTTNHSKKILSLRVKKFKSRQQKMH